MNLRENIHYHGQCIVEKNYRSVENEKKRKIKSKRERLDVCPESSITDVALLIKITQSVNNCEFNLNGAGINTPV